MKNQDRLLLYELRDAGMRLDDCALFFLRGLRGFCGKVILLLRHGTEDEIEGRPERDAPVDEVISLSDYDAAGWRGILCRVGWTELEKWQEIILTSDAVAGPVLSPGEMFREMESREELDYWGVTGTGFPLNEDGQEKAEGMQELAKEDFLVLRRQLILRPDFQELIDHRGTEEEKADPTSEASLVRKMRDAGFRGEIYLRTPEEGRYTPDYLQMDPVSAIEKGKCPFFLWSTFTCPQMESLAISAGEQPWNLFQYLKQDTDYDTEMLMDHLIRTCHQDDICRALRMTWVLPSAHRMREEKSALKAALVMHLYYSDLLEESLHYARSMPASSDICVLTSDEEKAERIRETFSELPNRVEVRVTRNRGRDAGSLLVGAADLQEKYDLICFYHDKKSSHVQPPMAGQSFAHKLAECALGTPIYVENVIATFEANPRLGMLTGLTPHHGKYIEMMGNEWSGNFAATKELAGKLGIRVPLSEEHIPAIGLGDVFWFRTRALAPMFRRKWRYEDFPEEPVGIDGTLLHAIERLYPFAVQEAGFLPGKGMPDHLAALEIENLAFYTREYTKVRMAASVHGTFAEVMEQERVRLDPRLCELARSASLSAQMRLALKRMMPRKLYRGIVKAKRALFGPRDVSLEAEEELDRKLKAEYQLIRDFRT